LLDYLVSLSKKKPDDKGDIVVGGIITFIVRKFGVGEESEVNMIEEYIFLNLDTLTSLFFIKPHGYTHNFQLEWKVNNANFVFFIILPNPDITNPEVVENCLYVGTNEQVHNDGSCNNPIFRYLVFNYFMCVYLCLYVIICYWLYFLGFSD